MSLSLQTETDLNFLRDPPSEGLLSNEFNVDPIIEMSDWAQYGISSSVMDIIPTLPREEDTNFRDDLKKELDLSIVQEIIDNDTKPSIPTIHANTSEFIDIASPLEISDDVDNFDLPTFLEVDNDAEFMELIASNEVTTEAGSPLKSKNVQVKTESQNLKIKEEKHVFVKQEKYINIKQEKINIKQEKPFIIKEEKSIKIKDEKFVKIKEELVEDKLKPQKRSARQRIPKKPVQIFTNKPVKKQNNGFNKRQSCSVGKKLDFERRCYVYENEVTADKLKSSESSSESSSDEDEVFIPKSKGGVANLIYTDSEVSDVDIETVSDGEGTILKAKDVNSLLDKFEAETQTKYTERTKQKVHNSTLKQKELNKCLKNDKKKTIHETIKNKDISPELLQRMKENSKKKAVQVIEAMPTKKTKTPKIKFEPKMEKVIDNRITREASPEESLKEYMDKGYPKYIIAQIRVAIDHSYCSFEKKENAIEIIEEEDDIPIKKEPIDPTLAILPKQELSKQENMALPIQQPRTGVGQETNMKTDKKLKSNLLQNATIITKNIQRNVNGKLQNIKVQQVQGKFQNINGKIEPVKSPSKVIKKEETICSQPFVKNADGKLMVSLLKSNTIHGTTNNAMVQQNKRKLNLEEYKKRRDFVFNSNSTNNTPITSTNTSPKHVTDQSEYLKNLSKMANDVLKCKKGSSNKLKTPSLPDIDIAVSPNGKMIDEYSKSTPSTPLIKSNASSPRQNDDVIIIEPEIKHRPNNVVEPEIKNRSTVNFGTNTEESWMDHDRLNEIKPILENASVKIGSNSLLAACLTVCRKKVTTLPEQEHGEHWENKVVHFVENNKSASSMCNVYVQTDSSWCLDHLINNKLTCNYEEDNRSSSSRRSRSTSRSRSSLSPSSRSPSPVRRKRKRSRSRSLDRERVREIEERRVIYIGKLNSRTSKDDLRHRFGVFGFITNVSIHHRSKNDSYGFVTFKYKQDAYDAVEHGNDDPNYPKVDLSFGGRRVFCKTNYSDLDNVHEADGYYAGNPQDVPFDYLLNDFKKLRSRLP